MVTLPPLNESNFEQVPAGNHLATCFRVIDLGTQDTSYAGQKKTQKKVLLSWELPQAIDSNGQPFWISNRYTLSSSDKAVLRQHLESWRGAPFADEEFGTFDLGRLIGMNCLLNVLHDPDLKQPGRTFARVDQVVAIPAAFNVPQVSRPFHPIVYFDLSKFDPNVFATLSQGLQQTIAKSPEYQAMFGPPATLSQPARAPAAAWGNPAPMHQPAPAPQPAGFQSAWGAPPQQPAPAYVAPAAHQPLYQPPAAAPAYVQPAAQPEVRVGLNGMPLPPVGAPNGAGSPAFQALLSGGPPPGPGDSIGPNSPVRAPSGINYGALAGGGLTMPAQPAPEPGTSSWGNQEPLDDEIPF